MSRATNGLGWVVQQYVQENGWSAVTAPFPTQEEAEEVQRTDFMHLASPSRVYEALEHPNFKGTND